jgi:hypothetical protein
MKIVPGLYKHFKGKHYQVLFVGKHSSSLEDMVAYRAMYYSEAFGDNAFWFRPVSEFLEEVEFNGKLVPRFQLLSGEEQTPYIFKYMAQANQVSDE